MVSPCVRNGPITVDSSYGKLSCCGLGIEPHGRERTAWRRWVPWLLPIVFKTARLSWSRQPERSKRSLNSRQAMRTLRNLWHHSSELFGCSAPPGINSPRMPHPALWPDAVSAHQKRARGPGSTGSPASKRVSSWPRCTMSRHRSHAALASAATHGRPLRRSSTVASKQYGRVSRRATTDSHWFEGNLPSPNGWRDRVSTTVESLEPSRV